MTRLYLEILAHQVNKKAKMKNLKNKKAWSLMRN